MGESERTDKLEERLVIKATEKRIPLSGTFELSPICNMSCEMCYARLDRSKVEAMGGLQPKERWLGTADELKEAGCVFLLLTGGEPLLYPDFQQVYLGLQERGFFLTVNTNGTLIDQEWADFFAKHPPRRINITLYGADADGYEELCHYKAGYEKTVHGIRMLRENSVPVKMNVSLTAKNRKYFERFYEIADSLGVPVEVDSYMFPMCRNKDKFDDAIRLSPEECADYHLRAMQHEMPGAQRDFLRDAGMIWQGARFPGHDRISCRAGRSSFWIDWRGFLSPCFALQEEKLNIWEMHFAAAWEQLLARTSAVRLSERCCSCRWQRVCLSCAGRAACETGSPDGTPEYLCQFMDAIKKGFHV